ncbi:Hypothetical protein PHPALM_5050 [Phytophthora palmivora]|uniref:Uncharacterized protein n=1 Tax=Phytophthora palmivora TaxID=4796 RepID=A0A2P4YIB5_9STRA|nr:Hypothetical protein PHPALM_5050 [Phytophthora palmivora]
MVYCAELDAVFNSISSPPFTVKTCVAFTTTAIITAATFYATIGLSIYLNELPNGESFSQALGHPGDDSSRFTDFATALLMPDASGTGQTFPGSSMTNVAAFGDSCCTRKKGGNPDFTVTAFTTSPGEATMCSSTSHSLTEAPATTASPSTETTNSNAPVTKAPIIDAPCTALPATLDSLAFTDVPSTTEPPVTTRACP